eukprot:TRINITY_DN2652_c0_g1_i5.p1 TRINITY_DN2652_c0_g1~~TRINITY_DN2652_c0_g1_i5.p1  ORF type:complete len:656 (-),score=174.59 TRINITY_DN2652_c0_g1_i5:179-2146(-)
MLTLSSELLLEVETIPQDSASVLNLTCLVFMNIQNFEISMSLVECINHLTLLSLSQEYHYMPGHLQERLERFEEAERKVRNDHKDDDDDDEESEEDDDEDDFLPQEEDLKDLPRYKPTVSIGRITEVVEFILKIISEEVPSEYESSLYLALGLLSALQCRSCRGGFGSNVGGDDGGSGGCGGGGSQAIEPPTVRLLMTHLIQRMENQSEERFSREGARFLVLMSTVIEGVDTSPLSFFWDELYRLCVARQVDIKKWFRSRSEALSQKEKQFVYVINKTAIVTLLTELMYKGEVRFLKVATSFFQETCILFADPLLMCDACVATYKSLVSIQGKQIPNPLEGDKAETMCEGNKTCPSEESHDDPDGRCFMNLSDLRSDLTDIFIPNTVKQVTSQLVKSGPSMQLKQLMIKGLVKISTEIEILDSDSVNQILSTLLDLLENQLPDTGGGVGGTGSIGGGGRDGGGDGDHQLTTEVLEALVRVAQIQITKSTRGLVMKLILILSEFVRNVVGYVSLDNRLVHENENVICGGYENDDESEELDEDELPHQQILSLQLLQLLFQSHFSSDDELKPLKVDILKQQMDQIEKPLIFDSDIQLRVEQLTLLDILIHSLNGDDIQDYSRNLLRLLDTCEPPEDPEGPLQICTSHLKDKLLKLLT